MGAHRPSLCARDATGRATVNRRAAITALVAAVPGLSLTANQPIKWATKPDPPRYFAIIRPDGCLEIPLDGWPGWRVTFNGESIEISAAELFEALRPGGGGE